MDVSASVVVFVKGPTGIQEISKHAKPDLDIEIFPFPDQLPEGFSQKLQDEETKLKPKFDARLQNMAAVSPAPTSSLAAATKKTKSGVESQVTHTIQLLY